MTQSDTTSPKERRNISNREGCSQFPVSPTTNGRVRVRKRRSRGSFIIFFAVFLVISALKSTYGQHKSHTGHTTMSPVGKEAITETEGEFKNHTRHGHGHDHTSLTTGRSEHHHTTELPAIYENSGNKKTLIKKELSHFIKN